MASGFETETLALNFFSGLFNGIIAKSGRVVLGRGGIFERSGFGGREVWLRDFGRTRRRIFSMISVSDARWVDGFTIRTRGTPGTISSDGVRTDEGAEWRFDPSKGQVCLKIDIAANRPCVLRRLRHNACSISEARSVAEDIERNHIAWMQMKPSRDVASFSRTRAGARSTSSPHPANEIRSGDKQALVH